MTGKNGIAALALALAVAGGTGCSSHAGAAAAGAGAAYYLTSRGAEGFAQGNMDQVAARIPGVMSAMGITPSGTENNSGGAEREFKGTVNGMDVNIELEKKTETETLVQVTANTGTLRYDKDYARQVVERIVTASANQQ